MASSSSDDFSGATARINCGGFPAVSAALLLCEVESKEMALTVEGVEVDWEHRRSSTPAPRESYLPTAGTTSGNSERAGAHLQAACPCSLLRSYEHAVLEVLPAQRVILAR